MLTGRQMGKSSLRVQTARRLQAENTACSLVDITGIGTAEITPLHWYAGFTATLANSFKIKMNVRNWWREREHLPPVLRLNEFIEQVLLPAIVRSSFLSAKLTAFSPSTSPSTSPARALIAKVRR
ncbi:hypothetical protein [Microcoleus sp.]|uniref:hypothetical protein n=1 Tax=Microcoleus sp. TaxID=44472 RepID=UPI0035945F37